MAAQGRGKSRNWDPMRDDYDDKNYDQQYPDDDVNGGVQLDHYKLYVKNISKALNEDGLRAVFEKYSSNVKVYMSKDPLKRYAIVTFETPGEAKLAMMKLNRTEPLKLVISVAHKKKNQDNQNQRQSYSTSQRDYSESGSSKGWSNRKQEDPIETNDLDESIEDDGDLGLEDCLDADSELEQENLKLKYLELKAEQIKCKQRIILLNKAGKKSTQRPLSRCILPDGRIIVKNDHERSSAAFGSAGGDTITTNCSCDRAWIEPTTDTAIPTGDTDNFRYTESYSSLPALQQHICLTCSSPADSYCGRCGVAPYCSQKCQQDDWQRRHRSVCHNLSRGKVGPEMAKTSEPEPVEQSPSVPPREPAPTRSKNERVKDDDRRQDNGNNTDRPKRNFHTPDQKVNRNQNFKNYNNLRRPKILNENNNVQGEEESFDSPETKPSQVTKLPEVTKPSQATKQPEVTKPSQATKQPQVTSPRATKPTPVQPSNPVKESKPVKQEPPPPKPVPTTPVKSEAQVPPVVTTTPVKQIVPKNYIMETLKVGDTAFLSATALASECRAVAGVVCVALHADSAAMYDALCGEYGAECERDGDTHAPQPGELFSYRDPEDEGWYRARRVSPTLAALVDAARVVTFAVPGKCARMPAKYAEFPEFCCVLEAENVKIQESLKCTIISKNGDKCKVSIENTTTETVSEGEISRWKPRVEGLDTPAIPEVERPPIKNNMKVYLVDCTGPDRVILRPSDMESCKEFDSIQEDVLLYAKDQSPLKEPPKKGDMVIAKFTDGLWYRALCRRTNATQNKYQLEYLEYGNIEISTKENLYPCPASLRPPSRPAPALRARLPAPPALAPPALEYLNMLRDDLVELVVTLVDGSSSAPSGAEVQLHIAKNNESVNKKIMELSTPDWKKLEDKGVDVIETPRIMMSELTYLELPSTECELQVFVDLEVLKTGSVNARPPQPGLQAKLDELTERMAAYCNSDLGKDPYLPKPEEICIALCPPYPQWFRAILVEQVGGAGGELLRLCYLDFGFLDVVPVTSVRKMLPEFMSLPALALHLDIRGFPIDAPNEVLAKAYIFMACDENGQGKLRVRNSECYGLGMYNADAPELLAALQ